jgi:hypothetical protein
MDSFIGNHNQWRLELNYLRYSKPCAYDFMDYYMGKFDGIMGILISGFVNVSMNRERLDKYV